MHKAVSPGTYPCNLCKITFSGTDTQKEWREFLSALPVEVEFLHKDEFKEKYKDLSDSKLPAVFRQNGSPQMLVTADEINGAKNISDLEKLISKHL